MLTRILDPKCVLHPDGAEGIPSDVKVSPESKHLWTETKVSMEHISFHGFWNIGMEISVSLEDFDCWRCNMMLLFVIAYPPKKLTWTQTIGDL